VSQLLYKVIINS